MNANTKRVRVENWILKNKKFFSISAIDNTLMLKGSLKYFVQEGRRINNYRIHILFKEIKKITNFKDTIDYRRATVENWLEYNSHYINKSAFDTELGLKGTVRYFLYDRRKISNERIKLLYVLIKKISQF